MSPSRGCGAWMRKYTLTCRNRVHAANTVKLTVHPRQKTAVVKKAVPNTTPSTKINTIAIPLWAERAGLRSDYRGYARMYGEEAAASICRRLKAEDERVTA